MLAGLTVTAMAFTKTMWKPLSGSKREQNKEIAKHNTILAGVTKWDRACPKTTQKPQSGTAKPKSKDISPFYCDPFCVPGY